LNQKQRLTFLDFIRGLAALSVVVQHAGESLWPSFAHFSRESFNVGKFGVLMFFLTSGFVIPFTMERGRSLGRFWINRFFRLYPLYWTSLIVAIVLAAVGLYTWPTSNFSHHLGLYLAANATMCQEAFRVPHAVSLYYTLSLELFFYVFFSILFLFDVHRKSVLWSSVALVGAAFLTIVAPIICRRRMPMAEVFYLCSIFVGTCIYRRWLGHMSMTTLVSLLAGSAVIAIPGIYLNYIAYAQPEEHFAFAAVFFPWLAGYVVFLVSFGCRHKAFPGMLSWLGRISYSMYLLHFAVLAVGLRLPGTIAPFMFVVAGTLVVSHFSFKYIETPFIRLGHRLADNKTRTFSLNASPVKNNRKTEAREGALTISGAVSERS
jgi:peptidoglycan/LPS O-acetylase OafA/YrhL